MDLFQIARDNGEEFSRRYGAARAAADAAVRPGLESFTEAVQREGRLAVNMRPTILLRFLALEGDYDNVYERAEHLEHRSGQPREELVRELEDRFYERRMTFDRLLDRSKQIHYGALNLGGLGVTLFGDHCLVFEETFAAGLAELAYLWGNSLETYLSPDAAVDEESLRRDACPHSHRHCLAALKHGTEAASLDKEHWPALICSHDRFIEAIFIGNPSPGDLHAVRMKEADYKRCSDSLVDAALGRLSAIDRHLVEELDTILRVLKKCSISLKQVPA